MYNMCTNQEKRCILNIYFNIGRTNRSVHLCDIFHTTHQTRINQNQKACYKYVDHCCAMSLFEQIVHCKINLITKNDPSKKWSEEKHIFSQTNEYLHSRHHCNNNSFNTQPERHIFFISFQTNDVTK